MSKPEYFNLFAWLQKKKTKIGYAYLDEKTGALRLKPDGHLDAVKLGRALIKGDVLIEQRQQKPQQIETDYQSAADDYD